MDCRIGGRNGVLISITILCIFAAFAATSAFAQEPPKEEDATEAAPAIPGDIASLFSSDASWRPVITTRFTYEAEQDDFEYFETFVSTRFTLPQVANSLSSTLTLSAERADIDTPSFVDLPNDLYVLGVNYSWIRRLNKDWTLRLNANPRFASDFDNTGGDALQLRGAAMAVYRPNPRWLVGFGVYLTGRDDIPLVAGPGAVWRPRRNIEACFSRNPSSAFSSPRIVNARAGSTFPGSGEEKLGPTNSPTAATTRSPTAASEPPSASNRAPAADS